MEKFAVSPGICGYIVNALAPLLSKNVKGVMTKEEVDNLILLINDPKVIVPLVEEKISEIREWRKTYIQNNLEYFKQGSDTKDYLEDLVANYEISDSLTKTQAPFVLFLRQNAWFHPMYIPSIKHEEKDRIEEERPFTDSPFLYEYFYPKRKLNGKNEIKKNSPEWRKKDDPCVFVGDMMGHYCCFVSFHLKFEGSKFPILLLIDSTVGEYIGYTDVLTEAVNLAFEL